MRESLRLFGLRLDTSVSNTTVCGYYCLRYQYFGLVRWGIKWGFATDGYLHIVN